MKSKLIAGILISLSIATVFFEIIEDPSGKITRSFIVPLLTFLYFFKNKGKTSYFFFFLLFFSIAESLVWMENYDNFKIGTLNVSFYHFYIGNLSSITAYIFLILEILKSYSFKSVIDKFPVHIMILFVLDIYTIYLVSETAFRSPNFVYNVDKIIEVIYNGVVMFLLTVALMGYINRDSKKAMNLLLGSLCLVFSEILQVATFYVSENNTLLGVSYIILLIFAFTFLYVQSDMSYSRRTHYESVPFLKNIE